MDGTSLVLSLCWKHPEREHQSSFPFHRNENQGVGKWKAGIQFSKLKSFFKFSSLWLISLCLPLGSWPGRACRASCQTDEWQLWRRAAGQSSRAVQGPLPRDPILDYHSFRMKEPLADHLPSPLPLSRAEGDFWTLLYINLSIPLSQHEVDADETLVGSPTVDAKDPSVQQRTVSGQNERLPRPDGDSAWSIYTERPI